MKKSKLNPISKSPARQANLVCNSMYSEIIHWLFRDMCAVCGHVHTDEKPNDPHHLVHRSKDKKVEHEILNGILLCRHGCHPKAEKDADWLKGWLDIQLPLHHQWLIDYRWVQGKIDYDHVKQGLRHWQEAISMGRVPPIQPVWQLDEVASREYMRRSCGLIVPEGVKLI